MSMQVLSVFICREVSVDLTFIGVCRRTLQLLVNSMSIGIKPFG